MLAKYVTAGIAGSLLLASAAFAAEDNAKTTAPAAAMQSSISNTFVQLYLRVHIRIPHGQNTS